MAHKLISDEMVEKAMGAAKWNNWSVGTRNGIRASLEAVADDLIEAVAVRFDAMAAVNQERDAEHIQRSAEIIRSLKSQGQ
jgi:flagellin-specific chaperone FliS